MTRNHNFGNCARSLSDLKNRSEVLHAGKPQNSVGRGQILRAFAQRRNACLPHLLALPVNSCSIDPKNSEISTGQPDFKLISFQSDSLLAKQQGFTLIEAIIVITLTAIISSAVAVFIKMPIQGYFDSSRRAEMTDIADTALRRMGRDLHAALPNSVRVTNVGAVYYLEFLPALTGGRYRADTDPGNPPNNDPLDFTIADTSFDVLGPPVTVKSGWVTVYNLGIPGANAYAGNNTSAITSVSSRLISINAMQFPFASPSNRFQIIGTPVSYVCNPGAGTLTRYWNYTTSPTEPSQPTRFSSGASALLASHVSSCSFTYTQQVITQQAGLLAASLQITESGETVSLYDEIHVSNAP